MKKIILSLLFFVPLLMQAQTDTTAKLQDARTKLNAFTNGNQTDTSVVPSIEADLASVLAVDSNNASAQQGLATTYNGMAAYWNNTAQPFQASNPALYNTYMQTANNYISIAVPCLQRYLTIKGIKH